MVLALMFTGVGSVTVCQPLAVVLVKVALAKFRSRRRPQAEQVRAGVARAAIELQRSNLARGGRGELHADFQRRAVAEIGLCRRVRCAEETDCARGGGVDVVVTPMLNVSLAARPPASVAVALTLSVPTFAAAGVPLKVRVVALNASHEGRARAAGKAR